jgi:hypothetical protein
LLTFIIVQQLDRDDSIQPKLLKRVCMLYCNRQIRKLFIVNDNTPASLFSDLLLAIGLAAAAIVLYDNKLYNQANTIELKQIHEGLMYMYGDIMDFAFEYGILNITVCAFAFSIYLQTMKPPTTHLQRFGLRLASIINANLLSQGLTSLIPTSSIELKILQCLASTCILRMMLPDMQYYLTYLAAQQIALYFPDAAPLFFCITICLDLLPTNSQEWVSNICFTYVLIALANYTVKVPFWGMVLILVLSHYADYIIRVGN